LSSLFCGSDPQHTFWKKIEKLFFCSCWLGEKKIFDEAYVEEKQWCLLTPALSTIDRTRPSVSFQNGFGSTFFFPIAPTRPLIKLLFIYTGLAIVSLVWRLRWMPLCRAPFDRPILRGSNVTHYVFAFLYGAGRIAAACFYSPIQKNLSCLLAIGLEAPLLPLGSY
jgi:hypothetical protein